MTPSDELRQLRRRREDDDLAARLPRAPAPGNPTVLAVTTVVSSYPTAASAVYAMQPASAAGTEGEGLPTVLNAGGAPFYATNLGTSVPPRGTFVLCTQSGPRWTFRYDG